MEQQKKKRAENWSSEEKEILRHLIAQSADIIEAKSTKTSANLLKIKEWKIIATKFNEITGKCRTEGDMKLAWKRMKLSAKSNLSSHNKELTKTGGGEKPPSPSPEDLEIMAIAPHDFINESNDFDSDAVIPDANPTISTEIQVNVEPGPSCSFNSEILIPINNDEDNSEQCIIEIQDNQLTSNNRNNAKNIRKKGLKNKSDGMRQLIVQSNVDLKKRQVEIMEVEHEYNIKINNLKIKKLELEIELLENKKKYMSGE